MAILPKVIYTFNTISFKIPTQLFTDMEEAFLIFIRKNKKPGIMNTILNNKRTSGEITIPNLKLLYKTIVKKIAWYRYSD